MTYRQKISNLWTGLMAAAFLVPYPAGAANAALGPEGSLSTPAAQVSASSLHRGKVSVTMDSGGYTYVEFEENGKKTWAASSVFKVAVGDMIEFSGALPMQNFTSKTLNKTFDSIYFAGSIQILGSGAQASTVRTAAQGQIPIKNAAPKAAPIKPGSVKKADGGVTVEECFAQKKTLNGKTVKVRGRVVKFLAEIMGKNWLHIQDGTGAEGTNDLTVTTLETAAVGDLILVTGTLAGDKDFGSGYAYAVIVENAKLRVEEASAKTPLKTP